ncbi:hypothetical protein TNCV_4384441 [Trichonephila clavipes]|nr:hypothetical protein TNCV_4384441 [Trichonephila clavipes]
MYSAFVAGGTLNSRRAISPPVRLVTGNERWETPDPPPRCSPSKLGWNRAKSYCHLYTRAFGDGPRNFEVTWTTPELVPLS